ncbi:ankyrin repeat domain-containing protein 46-like [Archocentrus centrarchus]|uniref:ankyrin repeat domain-containing protein 46-like n=1 Tax=Archocentrus centrarchus TaxID=63155 RepID=UPI0011EA2A95|nr:ankyrin repeat domain-containing protein 46-like [Archocentrus centrarchus]
MGSTKKPNNRQINGLYPYQLFGKVDNDMGKLLLSSLDFRGLLQDVRTTWQEFVEDLGFWRVLLLLVVIALLSLSITYDVNRVLPFSTSQLELVH